MSNTNDDASKLIVNLIDVNPKMLDAWATYFTRKETQDNFNDYIKIIGGDFFSRTADAVVSPANSFGFMDGGLDLHISKKLGWGVQKKLQYKIQTEYNGELLVGQAIAIPTSHKDFKYCISAPTMRVPMILGRESVNVYLAAKAAFSCALNNPHINSVNISGLGTGVGRVPFDVCAKQMFAAYNEVILGVKYFPTTWFLAQQTHIGLYSGEFKDLQKK